MTPPKVLGAPKPTSSVIMSNTFGAPFGGTTRAGHHGFESEALSLMIPPNFGGEGGSCLPSIVVVASGEPGVPVICCAVAAFVATNAKLQNNVVAAMIPRLTRLVVMRVHSLSQAKGLESKQGVKLP
jgi:hypothetical protein